MQSLAKRKSRLAFVTEDTVHERRRNRRVIVEVSRDGYSGHVRLEGMRMRFPFSFAGLYHDAARRHKERQRAEKKAAKKVRPK